MIDLGELDGPVIIIEKIIREYISILYIVNWFDQTFKVDAAIPQKPKFIIILA